MQQCCYLYCGCGAVLDRGIMLSYLSRNKEKRCRAVEFGITLPFDLNVPSHEQIQAEGEE